MKARKKLAAFAVAVGVLGGFAGMASAAETITAGGATFPLNLMESCRATFAADSTYNAAGDKVNYTGVGSGTGRTNFYKNDYQFAMSDSLPKTADTSYRSSFVLVPMISGAIGIGYRLDNVQPAGTILQLSSATIAKIFAGQIKTWNDAAIVADNTATDTHSSMHRDTSPDAVVEADELRKVMRQEMKKLPERERTVLVLYYEENLTLGEIGDVLGVSESRVSQIHTKAVLQMRARLRAADVG